jgi:hypothetical protein
MAEYWTQVQALANADLNAEEFANRQILLRGLGVPTMQAPLGTEYEDMAFSPANRYRKTGLNAVDWTPLLLIEKANSQEVENGINDDKMVTPAGLANRLDDFAAQILSLPPQSTDLEPSMLVLQADDDSDETEFSIQIPNDRTEPLLSVIITNYGMDASLSNISGGIVGQLINIRKGEPHSFSISSNTHLKLSDPFELDDSNSLDNTSLQKISDAIWVEVTRKNFS